MNLLQRLFDRLIGIAQYEDALRRRSNAGVLAVCSRQTESSNASADLRRDEGTHCLRVAYCRRCLSRRQSTPPPMPSNPITDIVTASPQSEKGVTPATG